MEILQVITRKMDNTIFHMMDNLFYCMPTPLHRHKDDSEVFLSNAVLLSSVAPLYYPPLHKNMRVFTWTCQERNFINFLFIIPIHEIVRIIVLKGDKTELCKRKK